MLAIAAPSVQRGTPVVRMIFIPIVHPQTLSYLRVGKSRKKSRFPSDKSGLHGTPTLTRKPSARTPTTDRYPQMARARTIRQRIYRSDPADFHIAHTLIIQTLQTRNPPTPPKLAPEKPPPSPPLRPLAPPSNPRSKRRKIFTPLTLTLTPFLRPQRRKRRQSAHNREPRE